MVHAYAWVSRTLDKYPSIDYLLSDILGMRLALLTLKSALFHIISNYQIVRSKQKIVTDGDSGFGVVLQGDINLEYRRFAR